MLLAHSFLVFWWVLRCKKTGACDFCPKMLCVNGGCNAVIEIIKEIRTFLFRFT
jgi:hypothetical protein